MKETIPRGGWCTGFKEYWYNWRFKKVYIGDCCKKHDEKCSTKVFIKCLWKKRIIGTTVITAIASTVCLVRYGKV